MFMHEEMKKNPLVFHAPGADSILQDLGGNYQ
jgi:hypothetical protein